MSHLRVTTSNDVENSIRKISQWDPVIATQMRMHPNSLKLLVWDAYCTGAHQRLMYVTLIHFLGTPMSMGTAFQKGYIIF